MRLLGMCIYNDIYDINRNRFIFNLSICDYYYWDHNKKILYADHRLIYNKNHFKNTNLIHNFLFKTIRQQLNRFHILIHKKKMIRIVKMMSRIYDNVIYDDGLDQEPTDICRMPTINNPMMNLSVIRDEDLYPPAACNANDSEIQENINVNFNSDLFLGIG